MTVSTETNFHAEQEVSPGIGRTGAIAITAITLLALCLGGWYASRAIFAWPMESAEFDVGQMPNRMALARAGAGVPARPDLAKDGIHPIGANMYRVTSGDFFMTLAPTETTFAPLRLNFARRDFLSQEQRVSLVFCRDSANAGYAKNLEITPDQAKQLATLRQQIGGGMKISDDDRNKLRAAWKSWTAAKDNAAKAPLQANLLALEKEVGVRSTDLYKKEMIQLAADVRKIVSDAQLVKFRQLRGAAAAG